MSIIKVPLDFIEAAADLRLPAKLDQRLQELLERNPASRLTESEQDELESLLELASLLSGLRERALRLLGPRPA
jgi:hypothetical protein